MDDANLKRRIFEAIHRSAVDSITYNETSLGFGFCDCTGREIPVLITHTVGEDVVLSDAGETWWSFVSEGYVDGRPQDEDKQRVQRLAALHGVDWNQQTCAFVALAKERNAGEVARRITAASIALDGWRAFYPPRTDWRERSSRVVEESAELAEKAGFEARRDQRFKGARLPWRVPLEVSKGKRSVSVLVFPNSARVIIERATMWSMDTSKPAIALVPEKAVAEIAELEEENEQKPDLGNVLFVARSHKNTAQQVVEAAGRLLEAA